MAETISFADSIRDARERFVSDLHAQAEQIQKLGAELAELRELHERACREATTRWDELARAALLADAAATDPKVSPEAVLEGVLGAVRTLMTCTIPEQVFEVVTEEAAQWGVRAAVFDVRGKAAWGASARGFDLPENTLRSLIIPLSQDTPFRHVCETAGHVDASAETLRKNRNVLDKLKPPPHAPILLLPIRSAGTVSAILYTDPGEKGSTLPVNALKILAEFAGAQIDRLIALSGGFSEAAEPEPSRETTEVQEPESAHRKPPAEEAPPPRPFVVESHVEVTTVEGQIAEPAIAGAHIEVVATPSPEPAPPSVEAAGEVQEPNVSVFESQPATPVVEPTVMIAPSPVELAAATVGESVPLPVPAEVDTSPLSEAEQKVHRDAKRFARLLVSEIELYNKAKVAEGRKNRDLYKRLKSDIDRSRQTFEKRFSKVLSKQFDYLHDELVRTLAANDSSVLGPEYPGPSA